MQTDIFPEINIPVVSVIWQYIGLSTPEMEHARHNLRILAPTAVFRGSGPDQAAELCGLSNHTSCPHPRLNRFVITLIADLRPNLVDVRPEGLRLFQISAVPKRDTDKQHSSSRCEK